MRRLRKGDDVVVRTGRDKGKRGTVLRVLDEQTLLVEGINLLKRHMRPNPQRGMSGGIVEKEVPIQASNVALFNPTSGKGDRVGVRRLEDGKKVRYFKSNDEVVDV